MLINSKEITNQMKFCEKETTKYGDYGEDIVKEYLHKKGIQTMSNDEDKQHPFDILQIIKEKDTWKISMADVKTKPKLREYNGTGINIKHYNIYKFLQEVYNMEFFIYFIDETLGKCYGNYLNILETPQIDNNKTYPMNPFPSEDGDDLIIFHINNMVDQFVLTSEQLTKLKELCPKKYFTEQEKKTRLKYLTLFKTIDFELVSEADVPFSELIIIK
jgi:hypothetical protein